ncbi:MAG: hypothetical protein ACI856_000648, partial [Kiritimatiellia bacterium]
MRYKNACDGFHNLETTVETLPSHNGMDWVAQPVSGYA